MAKKDKKDEKKGEKKLTLKERLAAKKAAKDEAAKKTATPPAAETKKAEKAKGPDIEREILDATGEKPKKSSESRAEYLVRITTALSGLEDDKYKVLSKELRSWFEDAAVEINNGLDDKGNIVDEKPFEKVPPFPGAEPEPEAKKDDDKKDDKPAAKKGVGRTSSSADDHVPSKSPSSIARIIVCEKGGEISLEDLKAELKKRGVKMTDSQAHAVHNITKRVIKTLKSLGKLK